ncbi:MAG TPA: ABC transporter ATP-binding protein [Candidatus Corynebacterium gallistercoris]|uniref:ABC transporter ATP-binding protein n=1 Tax=Candidatus Corynebacterium gallistercoris TaxID=2838530 RepID=A0A9D1RXN9_9CORY|nr:ABC transporter ATP-binding protein [Candidatus Corynebacterium gallistercoris]
MTEITALRVVRGGRSILDIPSLQLDQRPGLLLGVNGAGKSTLFSVLSSRSKPTSGTIERSGSVALVEQTFRPILGFSSAEYCAYVAWLAGQKRRVARTEAVSWLKFVNLEHKAAQKCESLSGGEQARLAIATAMNSGADLLLLDEPSAALDPVSKAQVSEVYQRIVREGYSLLVSTHDVGDLRPPFQRVIVLDSGEVHFDGTLSQFRQLAHGHDLTPAHTLARAFAERGGDSDR